MSGVVEYADIARDIYREIQRNHDRGQDGIPLKQYLPVPRHYRNNFSEDRTWVLNLLKRALKRMVQDHVLVELDPKPLVLGPHPEFDPTKLDKLKPQTFNWLSACRTDHVLSPETLVHLESLTRFMRTHQQNPGNLSTILNAMDEPIPKNKNKRPILPPTNGINSQSGPAVKRQRSSGASSTAVGFDSMGGPIRHEPAPILPPLAQYTKNLQVPFMQGPYPASDTSSDDDALLARVQNLERVIRKHNIMVESSYSTVSELDDCLADLIAKCTERKEQAKIVAFKVERLEARLGIQNDPPFIASNPAQAGNNDALIEEQCVRIISLENKVKAAEEEKRTYQAAVDGRFRKMEMRFEQLQTKPPAPKNRTPIAKPLVELSPFHNKRIAVEILSAKKVI